MTQNMQISSKLLEHASRIGKNVTKKDVSTKNKSSRLNEILNEVRNEWKDISDAEDIVIRRLRDIVIGNDYARLWYDGQDQEAFEHKFNFGGVEAGNYLVFDEYKTHAFKVYSSDLKYRFKLEGGA